MIFLVLCSQSCQNAYHTVLLMYQHLPPNYLVFTYLQLPIYLYLRTSKIVIQLIMQILSEFDILQNFTYT